MCGIAGVLRTDGATREIERGAQAMGDSLAHRGPDDHGVWSDAEAGVALAHRRLAILDLSPAGAPADAVGRRPLGHHLQRRDLQLPRRLRAELAARGVAFRGHSDTEVMLEAFAALGLDADGEAADRHVRHRALGPARAHADAGARPARHQAAVLGEVRRAVPVRLRAQGAARASRLDSRASTAPRVAGFMRHNYVPAPHTIYEGVRKLEPGTILTLPWGGEPHDRRASGTRARSREPASPIRSRGERRRADRRSWRRCCATRSSAA